MILKMAAISTLLYGSDIDFQRKYSERMGDTIKVNPCLAIVAYF